MINSINSALPSNTHQASTPAAPKPAAQPQASKGGTLSQDQVTLKSAGDVNHDGDSK